MLYQKFFTPILILAAGLGGLLFLLKTPLSAVFYTSALAHSFTLLAIVAALFFVYFFSYQYYGKEKDLRWYTVSLAFYILGVVSFAHAVLVPAFGWGSEELFDISEHYGFFLTSVLLWGIIIPFSDRRQEAIYQARAKIFLGINFFLLAGSALLFFAPPLANVLFGSVNFFIGLTAVNFFALLVLLLTRQEDGFFTRSLPSVLALLTATVLPPFFYQEWNLVWWYYHFLWLASVLLLLLLRAKKGGEITEILFSSFSIRARLFIVAGLALLAIVINGAIDFRLSRNHLQAQTLENLTLLADMQEGQVLTYLDKLKSRTIDFASDGLIREELKKILSGDRQAVADLNRHLLVNKQPLDPMIFGIHVMDPNGKVVASSQGSEVGAEDMAMEEVFVQARGARYATAYLSDIVADVHFGQQNTAIMVTAPIINQAGSENLGVLMLFFKTQELSDILTGQAQTKLGALSSWVGRKKSMEMYLVNQDRVMVSESRFITNAPLRQKADTAPVRLCAKSEETSGEYRNYRETPVFGASMCLSNGWTLLVEIDKDEVFGALGDYLQQNLLSAGASLLLIFFALYLFVLGINSPLKNLSEAAQKISAGDFTARTALTTRDEFGELSRVFNQMAENIQKSRASLQEKVTEAETSRLAVTNILGDLEIAKNQIEQAKAKDEAILTSIGDAVMACDTEGKVVLFNSVAEALTGFSLAEAAGQHYSRTLKLVKESDRKPGNDFIADAIATGRKTQMINHSLLVRKDGGNIPVADSAAPVKNTAGEIVGCVVVFRDVSHEREVDRAKTEFVSLASHQLRTPLSTVSWYAEMLLAGDAGALNEQQRKYLDEVYRGNKRMVELVNALLNVSRLELGTFVVEPEPTDIVKLAKSVVAEQKPQIDAKKIKLSEDYARDLPLVNADPKLLGIVCQNLLSNAVKYTPGGGSINLSVSEIHGERSRTTAENQLSIVVADTGCGIPKDQQDKIFSKLFRADNVRQQDTEGTGLGLYIVKAIVDHSGGKIRFESPARNASQSDAGGEENKGSVFSVTLPLEGMKRKEGAKPLG